MERLITSKQNNKLIQMLNDQKVSISNIEVVDAKTVSPSPRTHDKLFRPFANKYGTPKQTTWFEQWFYSFLNKLS